jgi:hypothetical protein
MKSGQFVIAAVVTLFIAALVMLAVLPARATAIDVYDDHGGSVAAYDARWASLARHGATVRIVGPCQSACTVLLRHIPRHSICVTPKASLGFRLDHEPVATKLLWRAYPDDIKAWINRHGGLHTDFIWMRAPDVFHYFKQC